MQQNKTPNFKFKSGKERVHFHYKMYTEMINIRLSEK